MPLKSTVSALALVLVATVAQAFELDGQKKIVLHPRSGADIALGTVDFTPDGHGGAAYKLDVDTSKLQTFFLSMRDFKCAVGAEIQCFVPYPYKHPAVVTPKDMAWLEHDLLFFYKAPNDYGAKLQNGIIYKLTLTDHGLVGAPQAIDLNQIAAPPDDLTTPPYKAADREDYPAGSRWIESLKIE